MGSRLVPLLLLFVAVAGVLAWALLSEGEKAPNRPAGPLTPGAAAPAEAPAELAGLAEAGVRAAETRQAEPRAPEASTTLTAPEAPAGGRIRGQVLSAAGVPVPGARVGATGSSFGAFDLFGETELPFATVQRTETDAEGRFELVGLDPGELLVAVRASGFAPFEAGGLRLPPGEESLELDPFRLAVGVTLEGRVVDAAGAPVSGARLYSLDDIERTGFMLLGAMRRQLATTNEDGFFRVDVLAPGPYRLEVQSEHHPHKRFDGSVENAGQVVGGLVLQLDRGSSIAGRVVALPDEKEERLVVRARPASLGEFGFGPGRRAVVGADGRFVMEGLKSDETYRLQLRSEPADRGTWSPGRSRSVAVEAVAGATGVELAYQPAAQLAFQVVDRATGRPLTELQVTYGTDWPSPLEGEDGKVQRFFPEGRVLLDDLRPDRGERVEVEVQAVGYRTYQADLEVVAGITSDLGKVFLDPVPVVRITVQDRKTGAPVVGAQVSLAPRPEPTNGTTIERRLSIGSDVDGDTLFHGDRGTSAETDEEGVAVLSSLEGETCNVSVRAQGYALGELTDLFLPTGATVEETVQLSRGGSVQVTVLDAAGQPLAGQRVSHRTPGDRSAGMLNMVLGGGDARGVTDSQGRTVFENLETGEHSFKVAEDAGGVGFMGAGSIMISSASGEEDEEWSAVQVGEGETALLTLHAKPRGSLTGRVTESGKALAGATVEVNEKRADDPGQGFRFPGAGGSTTRTDGEGRFTAEGLKVGEYTLTVRHPTRRMGTDFDVEVREGENRFDPALSVSVIEGRVLDVDGEPLAGVRVSAERAGGAAAGRPRMRAVFVMESSDGDVSVSSGGDGGGDDATTDADGRYELRGVLSDVELVVRARGEGVQPGSSEPLVVGPDEVRRGVDLTLEAGGRIELSVTGADGAPARFASVRATYEGEAEGVEPQATFLQGGTGELDGLRPGPWRVVVQAVGPSDSATDEQVIEVVARDTIPATFRLE